jgi:hypothetical protein
MTKDQRGFEKPPKTDPQNAAQVNKDHLSVSPSSNGLGLDEIVTLSEGIEKVSVQSARAFLKASPSVLPFLSREDFQKWGKLGERILDRPSWGTALCEAYFASSPAVLSMGSLHYLSSWIQKGIELAEESPKVAAEFLRSTPEFLRFIERNGLTVSGVSYRPAKMAKQQHCHFSGRAYICSSSFPSGSSEIGSPWVLQ